MPRCRRPSAAWPRRKFSKATAASISWFAIPPQFRQTPEAIRNILLPTPDGSHVPLGQVATSRCDEGAFMIYRENGRRYIPIKFSVRGRDLAGTMKDVQQRLAQSVHLPEGYHFEWAGEYDSLQKEQRRLAIVVPVSLLIILALLFTAFNSLRDALLVLAILPFGIDRRAALAAVHAHAVQHFRGGGICLGDWRVHAGRRGDAFRHSASRGESRRFASRD